MNNINLKALKTREAKLLAESKILELERKDLNARELSKNEQLLAIRIKIRDMQQKIILSEHAILRYLERVKEVNLEDIENEILDDKTREIIETVHTGKVGKKDFRLIVKNKTVVTIEV